MPLYDYQCEKCETTFEVERALTATGAVKCPSCGSTRTAKVFSAAGIVFKGSGFYVTDSKESPGKPETKGKPVEKTNAETPAGKPADSPASGKDSAKSE